MKRVKNKDAFDRPAIDCSKSKTVRMSCSSRSRTRKSSITEPSSISKTPINQCNQTSTDVQQEVRSRGDLNEMKSATDLSFESPDINEKTASKEDRRGANTSVEENYFFFYGKQSPFSQHYPANFFIDGIQFNCSEQYMMYKKSETFCDEEMKLKILASSNPVEQKRCGRKVRNFDKSVWNEESVKAVKKASKAKFTQNEALKHQLLETSPCILVEASPRDRLWGIGLGASNPKAKHRKTWRGQNKLGFILTQVRDEIMKEESSTDMDGGNTASTL